MIVMIQLSRGVPPPLQAVGKKHDSAAGDKPRLSAASGESQPRSEEGASRRARRGKNADGVLDFYPKPPDTHRGNAFSGFLRQTDSLTADRQFFVGRHDDHLHL